MYSRTPLLVVVMTLSMMLTTVPLAADTGQRTAQPTAAELFQQGMQQYAEGNYAGALESFRQAEPMADRLPREDRSTLYEMMQQAEARLDQPRQPQAEPAAPTAAQLIEQAEQATRRGQVSDAIALYEQVAGSDEATNREREFARARLAELTRQGNPDLAQARQWIAEAGDHLQAGRIDQAEATLRRVQASGVRLSAFDRGRVDRQLAVIAERRTATGEPSQSPEAEEEAAQADESDLMQRARLLRVQEHVADGRQAQTDGNHRVARRHFEQALALDPDNAEARQALSDVVVLAQADQDEETLLDRATVERNIRIEAALSEYHEQMDRARQHLNNQQFPGAQDAVRSAKTVLDNHQQLLPASQYDDLRNEADQLEARIAEQQELRRAEQLARDAERQAREEADRRRQEARERDAEVQGLLRRAATLQREQQYEAALALLNQALFLDPNNVAAEAMKYMIEDSHIYQQYRQLNRTRDLEIAGTTLDNVDATIPWRSIMQYPTDWPQLTQRRLRDYGGSGEESEVNRQTRLALRQATQVDFEQVQLNMVMDYLRNVTGLNFFVNWPMLESAGVSQDQAVTLQLSQVPAEQALRLVLQQVGAGAFDDIGFSVIEGIVTVSTVRDLTRTTDIRLYDIRDLLVQVPNFTNAPEFDLETALEQGSQRGSGGTGGGGGGGGAGGGRGLFGQQDQDQEELQTRQERIDEILELIQNTVGRPEDWEFFGGDVSSVRELNGNLIIRSTPDNHREVAGLLDQLREALALQINIEARFLAVDQNFLDEFGIQLDLNVAEENTGNSLSDINIIQDSFAITDRPTTILTPSAFAGDGGPFRRSFQMGISYLDDLEVHLLIRATQAHRQAISLTAPRLTLFNGQRAYVLVARQIAFISDLTPVPDAGGFDITPGVVSSGVVLDVEGTVSADRRYVTMTLRPSLATVIQPIRTIEIQAPPFVIPTNPPTLVPGASGFIELPEVELTSVRTTVSVPDRGTLLIGGQRLVGEIEIEAGVPVLSKVPFLNRLFTNRTTVKDESTLLILVKPTIIIQSEQEDIEFPGLLNDPQRFGTPALTR